MGTRFEDEVPRFLRPRFSTGVDLPGDAYDHTFGARPSRFCECGQVHAWCTCACDECDGRGYYLIDGAVQACVCSEPQT